MIVHGRAESLAFGSAKALPELSGVYWVTSGSTVLYVGQSQNLRQRWISHHRLSDMRARLADRIWWVPVARERLLMVEAGLIEELKPILNGRNWGHSTTTAGLIKTTYLLSEDQRDRLDRMCQQRHVPRSVIVREALAEMFRRLERSA